MSAPAQPYTGIEATGVGPGRLRQVEVNAAKLMAYARGSEEKWHDVMGDVTVGIEGVFDILGIHDPRKSYGIIGERRAKYSSARGFAIRYVTANGVSGYHELWRIGANYQDNTTRNMHGSEFLIDRCANKAWTWPPGHSTIINRERTFRDTYTVPELKTPYPSDPMRQLIVVTSGAHEELFAHIAQIGDEVTPEDILSGVGATVGGSTYELQGRIAYDMT